ncbi:MAG: D-3-phosphoglycerate dehydrogenase, partial [Pirellulaceae bacterium]
MFKVAVLDDIAQEGLDILDAHPDVEYVVYPSSDYADQGGKMTPEQVKVALAEADGAIFRSRQKATPDVLEGNKRLKAIARAGVGTDNIDKQAATRQGIVVMNTPDGNTISTAEHAFTLMASLSRNVPAAHQGLVEGRWDRKLYMGTQLAGKTLGIVGVGRIGQEIAKRAQAFDMKVIGSDPFLTNEQALKLGIEKVESVKDLLPRVDYLTVHTPKTPETENMIDAEALEIIKPGCRVINCARGGIYNEAALVDGLNSGKLGGVALDVYDSEPCTDSPLFGMKNVVCTPHLGASTEEAQTQVAVEACQLIINYLTTGEIRNSVNVGALDPQTLNSLRGSLEVAYRLGVFLSQWYDGSASSCSVTFRGDIRSKDTGLLTSAFCAGLLERAIEGVSIINADVLLKERGVQLSTQVQSELGKFASSITAKVESNGAEYIAGGTLFGNEMPRLIRLGEFLLEAYLDGILLVFTHNDVPGIIGTVGTIFGN